MVGSGKRGYRAIAPDMPGFGEDRLALPSVEDYNVCAHLPHFMREVALTRQQ